MAGQRKCDVIVKLRHPNRLCMCTERLLTINSRQFGATQKRKDSAHSDLFNKVEQCSTVDEEVNFLVVKQCFSDMTC